MRQQVLWFRRREVNDVFDCSEARYEQIETVGHFVEPVPEKKKESEVKTK